HLHAERDLQPGHDAIRRRRTRRPVAGHVSCVRLRVRRSRGPLLQQVAPRQEHCRRRRPGRCCGESSEKLHEWIGSDVR
ncbi:hypothetical protein PMAYCL1PPCAC_14940, partial [Pristionchus mayeri]